MYILLGNLCHQTKLIYSFLFITEPPGVEVTNAKNFVLLRKNNPDFNFFESIYRMSDMFISCIFIVLMRFNWLTR